MCTVNLSRALLITESQVGHALAAAAGRVGAHRIDLPFDADRGWLSTTSSAAATTSPPAVSAARATALCMYRVRAHASSRRRRRAARVCQYEVSKMQLILRSSGLLTGRTATVYLL